MPYGQYYIDYFKSNFVAACAIQYYIILVGGVMWRAYVARLFRIVLKISREPDCSIEVYFKKDDSHSVL